MQQASPIVRKMNPCLLRCVGHGRPRRLAARYVPDYDWRSMNGPDHYREAERLLEEAGSCEEPGSTAVWCLELAKVPAALAQVAATALDSDGREWIEVAGRRFGSPSPASGRLRITDSASVEGRPSCTWYWSAAPLRAPDLRTFASQPVRRHSGSSSFVRAGQPGLSAYSGCRLRSARASCRLG